MRNIAGELLKQVEDRTTQLEEITKDENGLQVATNGSEPGCVHRCQDVVTVDDTA